MTATACEIACSSALKMLDLSGSLVVLVTLPRQWLRVRMSWRWSEDLTLGLAAWTAAVERGSTGYTRQHVLIRTQ